MFKKLYFTIVDIWGTESEHEPEKILATQYLLVKAKNAIEAVGKIEDQNPSSKVHYVIGLNEVKFDGDIACPHWEGDSN